MSGRGQEARSYWFLAAGKTSKLIDRERQARPMVCVRAACSQGDPDFTSGCKVPWVQYEAGTAVRDLAVFARRLGLAPREQEQR